jgi:rhodanese-related sulfurtransferase
MFALNILSAGDIKEINITEAFEKQKSGVIVIDVRTPEEFFYIGHGAGHINIPLFFEKLEVNSLDKRVNLSRIENKLNKSFKPTTIYKTTQIPNDDFVLEISKLVDNNSSKEIILICKAGPRSKDAAKMLMTNGYKNVYSIIEGFEGKENKESKRNINGWKNSNLPWASF